MNLTRLFTVLAAGALITACESGDINIAPVNNTDNSIGDGNVIGGGGTSSTCASYTKAGQTIAGTEDGNGNCVYTSTFVGPKNNLTTDLFLGALPSGGAHIFEASLFVGEAYSSIADANADGIFEGGDGPDLTIEAGATLAFQTNKDFIIINRGSRILANGTVGAPITITSVSDINGTVGPEDVQQWGGIVINGFGVTNKCDYTGTRGQAGFSLTPGEDCSLAAEGAAGDDESYYGGDNDDDDSGILRYVVVKHTGAEVANGDELNGISFGGVGRSTVIENLETYSTYDDGIEMFGGAVDISNFVAVYVRDDSIDIDEGYIGTIDNALVIQAESDGNHCIESDGIGSYDAAEVTKNADFITRGLNSAPTINNLTCIISANVTGATHDPGAGWRFREGIEPVVNDSLVISSFSANDTTAADDNYCLRIDSTESQDAALAGELALNHVVFACQENSKGNAFGTYASEQEWAEDNMSQFATVADGTALDPTAANDADLQLLEGAPSVYSIAWATSFIDGAAPLAVTDPTPGTYVGAMDAASDWIAGWTYGIESTNRGQALWFE